MTNNIYPPDHLLRKWEELIIDEEQNVDVVLYEAFQAGADQELEACCEWLRSSLPGYDKHYADYLHTARRPKPLSLKEQALDELQLSFSRGYLKKEGADTIRRALESLHN
jgi:tRNA C32,U32 (ribose-2'-O)-methylase TrmJ